MRVQRPLLTKNILDGLATLAGVVEAGTSADILGCEEEHMDPQTRAAWANVEKACTWIRDTQRARGE